MISVTVDLGSRSYPIHIGAGLLGDAKLFARVVGERRALVVTNDVVAPLYVARLEAALGGTRTAVAVLPDGEQHKTLASFAAIVDRLIAERFHRDGCVVALGGGVIGDVAGFAAASYQRGIGFVQVPTTLLAQVDSSVGGKTAVNHPHAKNMIGAFYQPLAVIADTDTLKTLPERELKAGVAEIVKYGIIADPEFFAWLEKHVVALVALEPAALAHAIGRSCEIKAAIVAEDEREQGRRALLNLGHTFGHALEAVGGYTRWLHGEAVAIGIRMAANVALEVGSLRRDEHARIAALLDAAGLPGTADAVDADDVLEHMQLDKKAGSSGLRIVLPKSIGDAVLVPAPARSLLRAAIVAQLVPN